MSTNDGGTPFPQSMRQRRILDVASEHPTASVEELASMVTSATPELVERVLDRHGDPSADGGTTGVDGSDHAAGDAPAPTDEQSGTAAVDETGEDTGTESTVDESTTADSTVDDSTADNHMNDDSAVDDLSERQREILAAIAARPEATQRELADCFDVSTATINTCVNSIPGFEWADREAFVDRIADELPSVELSADDDSTTDATSTDSDRPDATASVDDAAEIPETASADGGSALDASAEGESTATLSALSALEADLDRLADRLDDLEATASTDDSVFEDPELVHKIVHACMHSEAISESEELRILQGLL